MAVVKYKTKLVTPRLGLCSNWLASLKTGSIIPIWIKKGSFKFPKNLDEPVIMIGPGTGVAPFRSFIQNMHSLSLAKENHLILFFGCRNEKGDFHFKEEWKELEKNNQLKFFCAFSRDQEEKM